MSMEYRPKKRGPLRLALGRLYFTARRHLEWRLAGRSFCRERAAGALPHLHAAHSTVFMRPLQRMDMRLQENKKTNIRLACGRLHGALLRPGETLSFWRLVGRPTRRRGFLDGLVLEQGRLRAGVGGGICQLSNLIFWLTLHTPLQVSERWRHGYDVFPDVNRSQPFGSGATVSYNYIDLQIFNPTTEDFQLRLWQDDERLYGEWRGECAPGWDYRVFEKNHRIESHYWGGHTRHNELYRSAVNRESGEEREEFLAANNALMMYNPLLEAGRNENSS